MNLQCSTLILIAILLLGSSTSASDFEVPSGFAVEVAANDQLVHDAFSMTLDPKGRPVVSGPGYIRTLLDDDHDGVFDRAVTWSDLPKEGAQGLWAEANLVYWVGDGGLWRSSDTNGDLIADGAATKVFSLPTGGEHDAHAIRRGPDGYWYLIVGNYAADIQSLTRSPDPIVRRPRAGTIWRISPDFSQSSAWAHGFRNAYDFDFLANGRIVTFDSDEEREVSLPWYRPTRVMVVSPGCDAGWVDSAWFDHDERLTMPQVISKLGRGSPTGVAVYHHYAFPPKYREAVFVLDWTFGRVIAVYPQAGDAGESPNRFMAETFMQPSGMNGFAPTDVCVSPDGSLLVAVGGRGTTGAIYRIRYVSSDQVEEKKTSNVVDLDQITNSTDRVIAALDIPCPWDSWSAACWKPVMSTLSTDTWNKFFTNAADKLISSDPVVHGQRIRRAAQYATYLEQSIALDNLKSLLQSSCPVSRSSAYWILARSDAKQASLDPSIAQAYYAAPSDADRESSSDWDRLLGGLVERQAFEAFGLNRWPAESIASPQSAMSVGKHYNPIRQSQLWAISRQREVPVQSVSTGKAQTSLTYERRVARALIGPVSNSLDSELLDALARRASAKEIGSQPEHLLEALIVLQACLGDFRHATPLQQAPTQVHALDGYRAMYANRLPENVREGWARWCMAIIAEPANDSLIIRSEAARCLAMLAPSTPAALDLCLDAINEDSHPTADLHHLAVLSCCKANRTAKHTEKTAQSLLAIAPKVKNLDLNLDSRWTVRLEQLFRELLLRDAALASAMVPASSPIQPEQLSWIGWIPTSNQSEVRKRIIQQLLSEPTSAWSAEFVRYSCSESIDPRIISRIRGDGLASDPALRIELLSRNPSQADYVTMLEELASDNRAAWPYAWKALARLSMTDPQREVQALAWLWVHLKSAPVAEIPSTALVSRLRSAAVKSRLANVPSRDDWKDWQNFLDLHGGEKMKPYLATTSQNSSDWLQLVQGTQSIQSDSGRGQLVFQKAKCLQCHGGGNALGPNLSGVSRRFSREDLFRAIYEPNRDISDRYRSLQVLTSDGEIVVGMKVYDSVDGVTLQTADGKVVRINQGDIESKSISPVSLMPSGLLNGLNQQEIADLYSYLRQL